MRRQEDGSKPLNDRLRRPRETRVLSAPLRQARGIKARGPRKGAGAMRLAATDRRATHRRIVQGARRVVSRSPTPAAGLLVIPAVDFRREAGAAVAVAAGSNVAVVAAAVVDGDRG